jgi:hypothetical protein
MKSGSKFRSWCYVTMYVFLCADIEWQIITAACAVGLGQDPLRCLALQSRCIEDLIFRVVGTGI